MQDCIKQSIEYATQRSYLDDLFQVYPTIPTGLRSIDADKWKAIEVAFEEKDNVALIKQLLKLEKFPIKDSYVAFLRMEEGSIDKNPQTINRIAGTLYSMGIDKLYERCSEAKETNTQMGPMFRKWITEKKALGIEPLPAAEFWSTSQNAILKGADAELKRFALEYFNYENEKGLDFVARFNGKYLLGEVKFITAMGGKQNNAFTDVVTTLNVKVNGAATIGIIDGIPWLKKSNFYRSITTTHADDYIMSALVLREFLYQF